MLPGAAAFGETAGSALRMGPARCNEHLTASKSLCNGPSGQAEDSPPTPTTSLACPSVSLTFHGSCGSAQLLAGALGLLLHPWGVLWLPNSAGLVRYLEEKPQVRAKDVFREATPLESGLRQAQSTKVACLSSCFVFTLL